MDRSVVRWPRPADSRPNFAACGRQFAVVVALSACCLLAGCSHGRIFARRGGEAGAGPASKDSSTGLSPSTLGTDFNKAPAGRTIPPAGLGVDLL